MTIYGDDNKVYNTYEEALAADEAHKKAVEEAEEKAKALAALKEKRLKEVEDARKYYEKLRDAYVKDYGCRTNRSYNLLFDIWPLFD